MDEFPDLEPMKSIAETVAADWGVELGTPFALSRYSYVAPVERRRSLEGRLGRRRRVAARRRVARSLGRRRCGSTASQRPVATRVARGARPAGRRSLDLPEEQAVAIAVDVARRLWRPAAAPFRWIGDVVPGWIDNGERKGDEGSELVPLARELLDSLEVGRSTLIHGDFHHHNILGHGDRYVAIDSKAMLGDPEYDVPSFLWNPLPTG